MAQCTKIFSAVQEKKIDFANRCGTLRHMEHEFYDDIYLADLLASPKPSNQHSWWYYMLITIACGLPFALGIIYAVSR